MKWKYEADKDLVKRTSFKWTILRPGGLSHESGTKKVSLGITHITTTIPVSLLGIISSAHQGNLMGVVMCSFDSAKTSQAPLRCSSIVPMLLGWLWM
jgi:hypothetical protein